MSSHSHWQTTPPLPNYGYHSEAPPAPEYSYGPKTAPRTHPEQGYPEAYSHPPHTPYESYPPVPGGFPVDDPWGGNDPGPSHGGYGYGFPDEHSHFQHTESSGYTTYERPPSPKYIGRRSRSRASSKVSSTGGRPVKQDVEARGRRKRANNIRGYKAPTVESVPTSPIMLPTLASDEDCVLKDNPDYTAPDTGYSSPVSDSVLPKKGERRPLRELFIVPDTATSTTESTAPSSPVSDYVTTEREPRQYTKTYYKSPPPPLERKPQPYSYSPKQKKEELPVPAPAPAPRTSYAASGADLSHRREDLRVPAQKVVAPSSPGGSWVNDYSTRSHSPHGSPRPTEQLVQRPASPDEDDLPPIPPCPGKQRVANGHWWKLRYESEFKVCEQCFEEEIYETDFAADFDEYTLREGETIFCSFNTPRIKEVVWPSTLDDGTLEGFVRYVRARAQVSPCTQVSSSRVGCWFQMPLTHPNLSMIACHACYEDVVRASKFEPFFHRMEAVNPEGMTTCHVSTAPFIEAHLLNDAVTIEQFKLDVVYRLTKVSPCLQDSRIINHELRWWRPKDTRMQLRICDACYCDGIYPTEFRDRFVNVYQTDDDVPWFCCVGAYDLNLVWKHAVGKGDYDLWFEAAVSSLSPRCEPIPKSGGSWKMIKDHEKFQKFSICERCAESYFVPFGFGKHLIDKPTDTKTLNWCGLSTAYRQEIVRALADAGHWGQFELFLDYLDHRVASAPCPGEKEVVRDKWWRSQYGWFCEECFRFAVRPSQFVKLVEGERSKSPQRCDLGSISGRMLWQAACKKPHRRKAMEDFERGLDITDELEDIRQRRADAVRKEAKAGYAEQFRYRRRIADLTAEEMELSVELMELKL